MFGVLNYENYPVCASNGRIMEGRIISIRLNARSIILSTIILSSLPTSNVLRQNN